MKSEQEALNLLYGGELMRTTAQHNLNKKSNRSHSIFTVYVTQRARSGVSEKVPCHRYRFYSLTSFCLPMCRAFFAVWNLFAASRNSFAFHLVFGPFLFSPFKPVQQRRAFPYNITL